MATKIGRDAAERWVATEVRRHGIADGSGSPIAGERIQSWRAEIKRGKAPALARETFDDCLGTLPCPSVLRELRKASTSGSRLPGDPVEKAKELARAWVGAVAQRAPRSAPMLTRRSKEMGG